MSEWISVKDTLPVLANSENEHGLFSNDILYIDETGIMYVGCLKKDKRYKNCEWIENTSRCYCCGPTDPIVTHWMPLPNIPEV